jgi:short-subunit dehydrogenase
MATFTLITGASKGIGRAFAEACADKGMNLILCARSANLLDDLAAQLRQNQRVIVHTYPLDLSRPDAAKNLANFCSRHHYPVNVLINNAGFGMWGRFETLSGEEQIGSVQLNVNTLVALTHAFLPLLKKNRQSYILNIASVAGFLPSPYFAVYAAAKAFVISFSRAIRQELKKEGVAVSCLCPGPTQSEFVNRAGMADFRFNKKELMMTAKDVAQSGLDGLFKKRDLIIPGFTNKLSAWLGGGLPGGLTSRVIGKIYRPDKTT